MELEAFKLEPEQQEKLEKLARETGVNKSQVLRDALRVYWDLWQTGKTVNPDLTYFLFSVAELIDTWEPDEYRPEIKTN